jgi:hypothetical protein
MGRSGRRLRGRVRGVFRQLCLCRQCRQGDPRRYAHRGLPADAAAASLRSIEPHGSERTQAQASARTRRALTLAVNALNDQPSRSSQPTRGPKSSTNLRRITCLEIRVSSEALGGHAEGIADTRGAVCGRCPSGPRSIAATRRPNPYGFRPIRVTIASAGAVWATAANRSQGSLQLRSE